MNNFEDYIKDTLEADTTLLGYIGGTSSKTRIFDQYIPIEVFARFTNTAGGAISYRLMPSGGYALGVPIYQLQKPDELYAIDIYSRSKTIIKNCFEQIDSTFHAELQASITGWKVFRIRRVQQSDIFDIKDKMYQRHLEYLFSGILDAS